MIEISKAEYEQLLRCRMFTEVVLDKWNKEEDKSFYISSADMSMFASLVKSLNRDEYGGD